MYHANHPDGTYQMANRVQVFDPPCVVSWEPGQDTGDGSQRVLAGRGGSGVIWRPGLHEA